MAYTWYGKTVEHYFRMSLIEGKKVSPCMGIWKQKFDEWFPDLSKVDREFIKKVFSNPEIKAIEAISVMPGDIEKHIARLNRLERDFAHYAGLL